MDGYKRIISNRRVRMFLLNCIRWIPDIVMLKLQYWIKFRRKLSLKNAKRFTEKIQLYKLKYRTDLMVQCSDKNTVREYIKEKGLGYILIDQYAVYNSFDDLDLSTLPEKFVLKLSNGSGTNYICRDKTNIDICSLKKEFKYYSKQVKANAGREWPYTKSESVIVAEHLLEDLSYKNNTVNDYKILCFNGKPEYIICITDRYTSSVNHLYYDVNWEKQNVVSEGAYLDADVPKPDKLPEMLEIAETLSEDFPFARIDLYYVENKIYFGEITFFPWSGYMEFEPDEFDFVLGEKFTI